MRSSYNGSNTWNQKKGILYTILYVLSFDTENVNMFCRKFKKGDYCKAKLCAMTRRM